MVGKTHVLVFHLKELRGSCGKQSFRILAAGIAAKQRFCKPQKKVDLCSVPGSWVDSCEVFQGNLLFNVAKAVFSRCRTDFTTEFLEVHPTLGVCH